MSLAVAPSRAETVAAGVPVVVSVGMVTVAMAGSLVAMVVPELASSGSMALSALLALGSPAPLWLTSRLFADRELTASYTGLTMGRRHVPRARILGADHRDGVVHLLLDDGSILRTPPVAPAVGEAIREAFARPADLFEETRTERELEPLRSATHAPRGSRAARICSAP